MGPATAAAWRSGGPLNEAGQPIPITAVAASPNYASDSTLFAAGSGRGYGSLYRSTDGGGHWAEIFYPIPPDPYSGGWFRQVAAAQAPSGPAATLFASYNGNLSPTTQSATAPQAPYGVLYRSTNRGQSWGVALARMQIGAFVLSPAFADDQTLFVMVEGILNHSTDGGDTWQPLPFPTAAHSLDVFDLAISPTFAADHTLFAGGYGPTHRSTDGGHTWQPLPGFNPSHALAVSPAFGLDRTLWSAYRLIEGIGDGTPEAGVIRSSDGGGSWQLTSEGLPGAYEPFPASLAVSPAFASDRSLFAALRGQFLGWDQHSLFRSYDGGGSWVDLGPAPGNPDAFDLAVTRTASEGVVVHVATERGVWEYGGLCEERLVNGDFETDAAWVFPNTPYPAGYSTALAHRGHRSLRAGIVADPDIRSYSSTRQTLTIPAGVTNATLSLWRLPLSQESGLARPPFGFPGVAAGAPDLGLEDDAQYILLLDEQGDLLATLTWERSNAGVWQPLSFDLSAYAGRTVQLHIGAFNDGDGKRTALYADEVSLVLCWSPAPGPNIYLPMLLRTFARPPAPTPTPVPPPVCYDGLRNGDFESNDAWLIKDNPVLAGYVSAPVHGGARAMRTGIAPGGANLRSYSPVEQTVAIPAGVSAARLRFWRYRLWGDGAAASAPPALPDLPTSEAELPHAALDTDFFYVLAIRANGALVWLLIERLDDPTWRETDLDLRSLAGQTVRLQFGTYNTGAGGRSATYIDDARLTLCPPPGALVLPSGWAQRVVGRPEASTIYADVGGALYRSHDAGVSWAPVGTMPPVFALMGNDPDVLFAGQGYPCFMGGPPTPFWRSSDGGASWQILAAGENLKPLAAHASQPWVYAAGCDGPYRSTDNGQSWRHQPDPLFPTYGIYHMAPVDPDWTTIWASGISEGGGGVALVSRDGGESWARTTPLDPDWGWIGGLHVSRFRPGRIHVGQVYGFYETPDDGLHWFSHALGLEDVVEPGPAGRSYGLFAIAESPLPPGGDLDHRLYLGTVRGLYTRDPGHLNWRQPTPQPFTDREVRELLLLDAAPNRLFVGSGSGVFVLSPLPP
jgi:photosystem II stability/assembly factor-like uncharacterized protein